MTVKELIEILKTAEPDMEVTIHAPDTNPYSDDESIEYGIHEDDIKIDSYYGVIICVWY